MQQGWKFPGEFVYTPREEKKERVVSLSHKLGRKFPPLMNILLESKPLLISIIPRPPGLRRGEGGCPCPIT